MPTSDDYKEKQLKWIRNSGIKKGDTVLCHNHAKGDACGWRGTWNHFVRQEFVGKTGIVTNLKGGSRGIEMKFRYLENVYLTAWFPFFVLVKIND